MLRPGGFSGEASYEVLTAFTPYTGGLLSAPRQPRYSGFRAAAWISRLQDTLLADVGGNLANIGDGC